MTERHNGDARALRWIRFARRRGDDPALVNAIRLQARQVHQRLVLNGVGCVVDAAPQAIAGTVTVQLVLTNQSEHDIDFRVESIRLDVQGRTGASSGNIDYVIVYGHSAAPEGERYRRQHGIWVRFENDAEGTMHARFVERYDEHDAAA